MLALKTRAFQWSALAVLSVSVWLAGCGSQGATAPSEGAVGTGSISGTLHFYTSQPDTDANKLVQAFKTKYPGVQVDVFRSGTEEVIARLNTEAQAGSLGADVMLLADAPTFEALKKKDLLMPYQPPGSNQIPQVLADPDHMYTPTKMIPVGIIVNTKQFPDPSGVDWKTLIDPANRGKVVTPSALYSGAAAYTVGVFRNQSDLGWSYFQQLKNNDVMVVKGNGDVVKRVATGERSLGIIVDFMAFRAKEQGSPVAFVYPKSGVPVITEPVAIAKQSRNPAAAKAFVDFILSDEGQKLEASLGHLPIRPGIQPPTGRPSPSDLKVLSAPTEQLAAERDQDKKEWSALFGN
ncbi:ABC transporter substrate-binding protein [Kyrpidia spormannii]|uniref:Extracellular solute-binding protein family 1 n=2 Tax=Kyrpidia spormannii TaxID=2055160 RepID=A0ACA8ZFS0_9BACL|nr:ABC transporter substrate-binding protein [Kyrpidia spormannii]CAB3395811.1 Extracellular solute-binding protein family 1 [Kyrpidia spormannii]